MAAPPSSPLSLSPRLHYAWIVAAVTFLVLLITAGVRATPGILMVPLEGEFGWSRAAISGAIAINIALFGLIGPFAASLMSRWGCGGSCSRLWRCSPQRWPCRRRCAANGTWCWSGGCWWAPAPA